MAERKLYSAEEKSAIVLEILQDGKKVSEVAEEHGVHPNQIMQWKIRRSCSKRNAGISPPRRSGVKSAS
jgi:transposase-like protein